ncbi:hypothetical protein GGX14DRAFT_406794 [Mycena pura]|uniref:F-box domain-containing protein n=1 Tax=Mycena pura TaxID=153505 RepID=A0AAD6UTI6_9AGAR|nr:hypothetical protein GGX14DRAFT_406794 [Mycena pura]
MSSRTISPELWSIVFLQVHADSLPLLCMVSRSFRAEAEHVLYHSVDLCELDKVRAWCTAMAQADCLASYTYFLVLKLPYNLGLEDLELIQCALRRCVNLERLQILADVQLCLALKIEAPSRDGARWSPITGCSFSLTHFTNTYFILPTSRALQQFWPRQRELRFLSIPMDDCREIPCSDPTALVALEVPSHALPRIVLPLQRLQIHMGRKNKAEELSSLPLYAGTLRTLNIVLHKNGQFHISELVKAVAEAVPMLQHFAVMEDTSVRRSAACQGSLITHTQPHNWLRFEPCPVDAVAKFSALESFVLQMHSARGIHFRADMGSWTPHVDM